MLQERRIAGRISVIHEDQGSGAVVDNIFTERCYAERGYDTVYCLSVRPSVTFRYRDHIGWNSSKIISRLISLGSLLLGALTSAI